MEVLGLVFAATPTERRPEMAAFAAEVLGLERVGAEDMDADLFALPDGAFLAVADPRGPGDTARSVGFLVADVAAAAAELRAAGLDVGEPSENERFRYTHFRAPDGKLYELVEKREA